MLVLTLLPVPIHSFCPQLGGSKLDDIGLNIPGLVEDIEGTVHGSEFVNLTVSGPAFSVDRQARGGDSEMPKIKVNINRLE